MERNFTDLVMKQLLVNTGYGSEKSFDQIANQSYQSDKSYQRDDKTFVLYVGRFTKKMNK